MPSRTSHVARLEFLEDLEDAHALGGVMPAARVGKYGRQRLLARVAERGMADVVAERDRLREASLSDRASARARAIWVTCTCA